MKGSERTDTNQEPEKPLIRRLSVDTRRTLVAFLGLTIFFAASIGVLRFLNSPHEQTNQADPSVNSRDIASFEEVDADTSDGFADLSGGRSARLKREAEAGDQAFVLVEAPEALKAIRAMTADPLIRGQEVKPRFEALVPAERDPYRISFNLFPDTILSAAMNPPSLLGVNEASLSGTILGTPSGRVEMVVSDGAISGRIAVGKRLFRFFSIPENHKLRHFVVEVATGR